MPETGPRHSRGRRLLALVATILAGGLAAVSLSACSSGQEADSGAAATRTISTPLGSVKVPTHPLRIVSVHSWTTESLYDLGAKPVGVEDSGAQYVPERYLSRWSQATKVTDVGTVDFEKIAALKPDLILGVDVPYLSKGYKRLSAIAPTVLEPFGKDWTAYPDYTARAIGASARLTALRSAYEHRIQEIRSTYRTQLQASTWDVIQGGFDPGNYWIYGDQSPVGAILASLGAHFASASSKVKGDNNESVSYEQAGLLSDADYILYYTNNDGSPANNLKNLFDLQAFTALKAPRAGHLVGTSDFLPGSYSDGMGVLDSVASALKKSAQ